MVAQLRLTTLFRLSLVAALASFAIACGDDDDNTTDTGTQDVSDTGSEDAEDDTSEGDTDLDTGDVEEGDTDTEDADPPPPPLEHGPVEIDLDEWMPAATGGTVEIFQITEASQIPQGMSVQARIGDWILDSGRALFVIEGEDRTMSPCPYGGNVIDGLYRGDDGVLGEDTLGELCSLVNFGLTFRGQDFEVLADGSEGLAVLAVTGDLHFLDFLNLTSMIGGYLPPGALVELHIGPDVLRPISVTTYYGLSAGSSALRVVSAMRNNGPDDHPMARGQLLRPGGEGVFFNPLNQDGGYGYRSLGLDNTTGVPVAFQAYTHPLASWAYVPDPHPAMTHELLPIGAGCTSVAGVTVTLTGTLDLFGSLMARPPFEGTDAIPVLARGETLIDGQYVVVGDGNLSTMVDRIYELLDVPVGTVSGTVLGPFGEPVAGAAVTAVDEESRGLNQMYTDADGKFSFTVPAGSLVELRGLAPGVSGVTDALIRLDAGEEVTADIDVGLPVTVRVQVSLPNGDPTPARLVLTCDGRCPRPLGAEVDLVVDDIPSDFAVLVPVGLDGFAEVQVEPGTYGVVVSRGTGWSTWPADAWSTGGVQFTAGEGDIMTFNAEIAPVIDMRGALGADFHVHALASSDSSVSNRDRIWNFVSEGLDVIVSTDHDFIVDFAPVIAAEGVGSELVSIIGNETTTSSYGHINSFPLQVDPDHRTGGAFDWGNGPELAHTPAEMFAWAHSFPGEQVVQLNHPYGAGTIGGLRADVLVGISRAPAEQVGMPEQPAGEIPSDTGFWSEDFTAIELMNSTNRRNFWTVFRWWLTMVGRGFAPTGTATTDTHKLYGDLGGVPRTFVFVSPDHDTPDTFDEAHYIRALNEGRAVGGNGPFIVPTLVNGAGDTAGIGDTIAADEGLELQVYIAVPEWMRVDTLSIYSNVTGGVYSREYKEVGTPLTPTIEVPFELTEADRVVVATGTQEHARYETTITVPLDITEDAYVVVLVEGLGEGTTTLWPVIPTRSDHPIAFANPIYVDADGGGYNNYPLQALRDERIAALKEATPRMAPVEYRPFWELFPDYTPDSLHWLAGFFEWANLDH